MRKIKFRGKDVKTSHWVYGGFHEHIDITPAAIYKDAESRENHIKEHTHYLIMQDTFSDYCMPRKIQCFDVTSETVCQFTGLYDNDGKEIYEGDIVVFGSLSDDAFDNCPFEVADSNPAYEVKWFDGRYIIRSKFDDADELCDNLCGIGPGSVGVTADCVRKHFLVIGNIYDNPDLIKREDD